jgi:hypothetical protein
MRGLFIAAALAASLAGPASAGPDRASAGAANTDTERFAEHRRTCGHYENRARFKPREGEVEYVVVLAESCDLALALAQGRVDGTDAARIASRRYLQRLTALRRLIVDMNVSRAYGDDAPAAATSVAGSGAAPLADGGYRAVSATGEYLIARRLGLQASFRKWLDAGVSFDFARR